MHGALRLRLRLDGDRIADVRAGGRVPAPRRREALRGPRLPADHRAGQPARLAERLRQRARRRPRRRADARHRGAGPRGLAAHPAGRAQPGAAPPDVPRRLPRRARRAAPRQALHEREARPRGHGGALRRPDALHVQPGRRAQGGPARRAGSAAPRAAADDVRRLLPGSRTRPSTTTTFTGADPRGRPARTPTSSRRTASADRSPEPRASTIDLRRDEPYLAYGELAAGGWLHADAAPTATPGHGSRCSLDEVAVEPRPGRRLHRAAARAAARARSTSGCPRS